MGTDGGWAAAPGPGRPRPLAAAALSALVPGAGQWRLRRRRRGLLLLLAPLLVTVAAVTYAVVAEGPDAGVTGWLLSPRGLVAVMAVNVAWAWVRLFATLDAWGGARRRGVRAGPLQMAGLGVLLAVVIVPHAGAAAVGTEAARVLEAVFVTEAAPVATLSAEPVEAAQPDVPDMDPSSEVLGPAVRRDTDRSRGPLEDRERLTVLLMGSDAGPGRTGTRVDVLVVASMNLRTGDVALVSVPRNLADVPMPDGPFAERLGATYPQRLMSLYPAAEGDEVLAATYAHPGRQAHVAAVEALLELRIDHAAMVDLGGFVDVVDAFGGVQVDLGDSLQVRLSPPQAGGEWRTYDLPAGPQRLDGHEAHAYVRSRTGSDDYDRMRRQRCLVGSLLDDVDTVSLLRALPDLSDVLVERVDTDIPVALLPDLARLAVRFDVGRVRTLGITPPTYTAGRNALGFYTPELPRIRQAVRDLLEGGDPPSGAADLAGTCG